MPSSAVRTYTEPDAKFGGIQSCQVDGTVTQRQVPCRGDPHRFLSVVDAPLQRKTSSHHAGDTQWLVVADTFPDCFRLDHAVQRL